MDGVLTKAVRGVGGEALFSEMGVGEGLAATESETEGVHLGPQTVDFLVIRSELQELGSWARLPLSRAFLSPDAVSSAPSLPPLGPQLGQGGSKLEQGLQ